MFALERGPVRRGLSSERWPEKGAGVRGVDIEGAGPRVGAICERPRDPRRADRVIDLTTAEDDRRSLVVDRPPLVADGDQRASALPADRPRPWPDRHPLLDDGAARRPRTEVRLDPRPGLPDRHGRVRGWCGSACSTRSACTRRSTCPGVEEVRRTISAVVFGIVLIILLTFWLDVYLSRSWMAYHAHHRSGTRAHGEGDRALVRRSPASPSIAHAPHARIVRERRARRRADGGAGSTGIGFPARSATSMRRAP